ncbi:2-hydroxyacid dehydrogenase [Cryobacterium luteum]|uniref:2-hydroxyacid dehydrogenase n=1 Tax=Cryobacterium luteum TaxID=1424661 RepID=UPI0008D8CDFE|nr:2-hydroxyacid dehydrogenase [Cryobacterium luteum]SEM87582.1 Phosphoglycerate dehydrogenase [Cryobacterium luteum]
MIDSPTLAPLRVLLTDNIMSRFATELNQTDSGTEWTIANTWSEQQILAALPDTDVLVCSSMSSQMAVRAPGLRLVHVTGAGYDKIPLADLAPGTRVSNTFHHGEAIAEHVIMTALMLSRRVIPVDRDMRAGRWRTVANDLTVPFHGTLRGRTLGLLGFGGIGQEVARLASALGMRVRAVRYNPAGAVPGDLTLDWVGGLDDLPELLGSSDVVVVTVPLSEATRGVIDARALRQMRPTGILINVARGPLIDEDALVDALTEKRIAGAALDVWWGAPSGDGAAPAAVARFADFDTVVLTPHYSGHALRTFQLRAADIAANVDNLAHGRPLARVVH